MVIQSPEGAFSKAISDAKSVVGLGPAILSPQGSDDQTPNRHLGWYGEDDRGLKLKGKLAIDTRRGAEA